MLYLVIDWNGLPTQCSICDSVMSFKSSLLSKKRLSEHLCSFFLSSTQTVHKNSNLSHSCVYTYTITVYLQCHTISNSSFPKCLLLKSSICTWVLLIYSYSLILFFIFFVFFPQWVQNAVCSATKQHTWICRGFTVLLKDTSERTCTCCHCGLNPGLPVEGQPT